MRTEWNLAACGINCAACGINCAAYDFYKAGHGDRAKQQEIINWFKRDHGKNITPEQTMCQGCHGPKEIHWSPDCKRMNCAKEKESTSASSAQNSYAIISAHSPTTAARPTAEPSRT